MSAFTQRGAPPDAPMLVTGSHRSGSTWVGRMLELAGNVAYIHEPFNIAQDRGICRPGFTRWFTYVSAENERPHVQAFERAIRLEYHVPWRWKLLQDARFRRQVRSDRAYFAGKRRTQARPLFKAPIALFSADWLATRFDMEPVVLIRHPAAFANSLRKAGWYHDFNQFLEQPLLMRDHLHPFADEIAEFAKSDWRADGSHGRSILEHAALLWRLVHHRIATYQQDFPHWTYVRHEDLSREPVDGFRALYAKLGLPFTDDVEREILEHSGTHHPTHTDRIFELKRNSRDNATAWKATLAAEEVALVRAQVGELADRFYADADW